MKRRQEGGVRCGGIRTPWSWLDASQNFSLTLSGIRNSLLIPASYELENVCLKRLVGTSSMIILTDVPAESPPTPPLWKPCLDDSRFSYKEDVSLNNYVNILVEGQVCNIWRFFRKKRQHQVVTLRLSHFRFTLNTLYLPSPELARELLCINKTRYNKDHSF